MDGVYINKQVFDKMFQDSIQKHLSDRHVATMQMAKLVGEYNKELKRLKVDYFTRQALLIQLQHRILNVP